MADDIFGDADRINDVDAKIDGELLKLAEDYVALENRAKEITEQKKLIREKAERMDQHPTAFRTAISWVKLFSNADRVSVLSSFHRMMHVLGERQGELFPEQAKKLAEREAKNAEKAAIDATKAGPDADTNPRSNPDAGGAKPQVQNPAGEDAEGDAALAAMTPATTAAKKLSQSEKAAAKRAAAGMN